MEVVIWLRCMDALSRPAVTCPFCGAAIINKDNLERIQNE
jgi:hypothetical protein